MTLSNYFNVSIEVGCNVEIQREACSQRTNKKTNPDDIEHIVLQSFIHLCGGQVREQFRTAKDIQILVFLSFSCFLWLCFCWSVIAWCDAMTCRTTPPRYRPKASESLYSLCWNCITLSLSTTSTGPLIFGQWIATGQFFEQLDSYLALSSKNLMQNRSGKSSDYAPSPFIKRYL